MGISVGPAPELPFADQVVVVVPTIRDESIAAFLDAWQWPCQVIVVEDNPEPTFRLGGVTHYSWQDIRRDLGNDEWIIPRRTDCIRSYGYWKAWQTGKPYIVTLDDDCLPTMPRSLTDLIKMDPTTAFITQHLNNLQPATIARWHNTIGGAYPRGYPYERWGHDIPIGISHGLWSGVPDFDSLVQLHHRRVGAGEIEYINEVVSFGQYYPMCGMNLAWRREYTPLMYFLLMGQDPRGNAYPFDRFGDIWAGIIGKKILDHLGVGVWSGMPLVRHERASNVWANFRKEHAGIVANETFWQTIDAVQLTETTPTGCYREIITELMAHPDRYWQSTARAMRAWVALYE